MASYLVAGPFILGIAVGLWLLFRSLRKWRQPPPGRDPEARQADARLWSKMNIDQR